MTAPINTAMHAAHITTTWTKCANHKAVYTAREIETLFRLSMRAAAGALFLLGWTRRREFSTRAGRRKLTTRWYPPGVSPPPIVRGRPRIDLLEILMS